MKEDACLKCGGACCKAFYVPPLSVDVVNVLKTLLWMMPWRAAGDVQRKNIRRSLAKTIRHRLGNIAYAVHILIFRIVIVRVEDAYFLGRGQDRWYAVTCRLLKNNKCSVYGLLWDKIRPEYCRSFTCNGQYEKYIYKKFEKEAGNGG